jgi:hypothetical protein
VRIGIDTGEAVVALGARPEEGEGIVTGDVVNTVDLAETFLREISVDEYPFVVEHAQQHIQDPDPDEPSEFEFGLDLILDGLERLRDAER